jgi:hypothetical protein
MSLWRRGFYGCELKIRAAVERELALLNARSAQERWDIWRMRQEVAAASAQPDANTQWN